MRERNLLPHSCTNKHADARKIDSALTPAVVPKQISTPDHGVTTKIGCTRTGCSSHERKCSRRGIIGPIYPRHKTRTVTQTRHPRFRGNVVAICTVRRCSFDCGRARSVLYNSLVMGPLYCGREFPVESQCRAALASALQSCDVLATYFVLKYKLCQLPRNLQISSHAFWPLSVLC